MSQVQFCKYCNEIIGESNAIGISLDPEIVTKNSDKSGNCHHEKPSEFKTKKFFGFLLKFITAWRIFILYLENNVTFCKRL